MAGGIVREKKFTDKSRAYGKLKWKNLSTTLLIYILTLAHRRRSVYDFYIRMCPPRPPRVNTAVYAWRTSGVEIIYFLACSNYNM